MSEAAAARQYTEREIEAMETQDLLRLYKESGNEELKWPLVLRYEGLIKNAAMQIRGVYSSFAQIDDIINEGILTLLWAIDKYDPDKGVKFETYVSKRIRGMIIDLARRQDWIPRSVRKSAKEIDNATMELYNELGRYPTAEEIAEHLHVSVDKYHEALGKTNLFNVLSLDMVLEETMENKKSVQLPSNNQQEQPEAHLLEQELHGKLVEALHSLKENEQLVVSLYYVDELNMKEIAKILEVSEPRISQIHANALRKMRLFLKDDMIG